MISLSTYANCCDRFVDLWRELGIQEGEDYLELEIFAGLQCVLMLLHIFSVALPCVMDQLY